jgi:hypothetical protein
MKIVSSMNKELEHVTRQVIALKSMLLPLHIQNNIQFLLDLFLSKSGIQSCGYWSENEALLALSYISGLLNGCIRTPAS